MNPTELGIETQNRQYVGTFDGDPCYVAKVNDDALPPPGMVFRGLRGLYGLLGDVWFFAAGYAFQIMKWDETHQYCGCCGARTEVHPTDRAKVCPTCNHASFPRISPAIIVAITRGNEILLARQHRFARNDMYSVVAGFVEPGETLEAAVAREVGEEVGLETANIHYFGSQPWPFPNLLMIAFTAECRAGTMHIDSHEIREAGWFTADALPPIPEEPSIARKLIDWFVTNQGTTITER
jgi:NAD+ diphosphatase